jgi:hypothetical protein
MRNRVMPMIVMSYANCQERPPTEREFSAKSLVGSDENGRTPNEVSSTLPSTGVRDSAGNVSNFTQKFRDGTGAHVGDKGEQGHRMALERPATQPTETNSGYRLAGLVARHTQRPARNKWPGRLRPTTMDLSSRPCFCSERPANKETRIWILLRTMRPEHLCKTLLSELAQNMLSRD